MINLRKEPGLMLQYDQALHRRVCGVALSIWRGAPLPLAGMGFIAGGQIIWRVEDNGTGEDAAEPDRVWGIPTVQLINQIFTPTPPVASCADKPDLVRACS